MDAPLWLGRRLLGAAMVALGAQSLWLASYVARLQPVPESIPGHDAIAYFTGAFLLAVGACLVIGKWARLAATALTLILLLWLPLYVPQLIAHPGSAWSAPFETFALFGAAWTLAALLPAEKGRLAWDPWVDRGRLLGRLWFGISLLVFGITHFVYHDFVATWIPQWLPAPQFWAYFTGAAHFAAGVAIIVNVMARLAATLAAVMYGSWVVLVHAVRVAAAPHDAFEWNGLFVASALCASALIVAAACPKRT